MKTDRDLFEGLMAKKHLKLLAKNTRRLHELSVCNNILLAYTPLEVYISRGIETLAEAAGKELKKRTAIVTPIPTNYKLGIRVCFSTSCNDEFEKDGKTVFFLYTYPI